MNKRKVKITYRISQWGPCNSIVIEVDFLISHDAETEKKIQTLVKETVGEYLSETPVENIRVDGWSFYETSPVSDRLGPPADQGNSDENSTYVKEVLGAVG